MSWARIDDEAWYHRKFEELQSHGIEGMAAIGLWAMCLSFSGQKKTPKITLASATMLCGGDRKLASKCLDLLQFACLAEGEVCFEALDDSLPSNASSTIIHNWAKYRSRDEAKAIAGRKGGRKTQEKRRSKAKQKPSKAQAGAKQAPSKAPTPDPDPVPVPVPVPEYVDREPKTSEKPGDQSTAIKLGEFSMAVANAGISINLSATDRQRFSKLTPVLAFEMEHALSSVAGKKIRSAGYLLAIIESERKKAAEVESGPAQPAAGRKPTSKQKYSPFASATRQLQEWAEVEDEKDRINEINKSGVHDVDVEAQGLLPKHGD